MPGTLTYVLIMTPASLFQNLKKIVLVITVFTVALEWQNTF